MRVLAPVSAMLLWLAACGLAAGEEAPKPKLQTLSQKFSYIVGLDVGRSVKGVGVELDAVAFLRGVRDVLGKRDPALTRREMDEVVEAIRALAERKQKELAEKNRKAGEAFLAANKKRAGVVTTATGLQYMVMKQGDGPHPKPEDEVRVHYKGSLIDGTEFDSSYRRGQPAVFGVSQVIPGWQEALPLMRVGGKYKVFVPPGLAYGERGQGPLIGPHAVLVFQIQLVKIEKRREAPPLPE